MPPQETPQPGGEGAQGEGCLLYTSRSSEPTYGDLFSDAIEIFPDSITPQLLRTKPKYEEFSKRKDLKSAAVCKNRTAPPREFVKTAEVVN